ncbi:MAG: sulfite exporter TauE/SafE family protein [Clostridia bacterium]
MINLFLLITSVLGGFIQAATGFGFAIICMSLWPLVLSIQSSAVLQFFAALLCIAYVAIKLHTHINYKLLITPLIFSLTGGYLGLIALNTSNDEWLKKCFGVTLVILSLYLYKYSQKIRVPANRVSAVIAGITAGILGGLFNITGPPMVLYYMAATDNKEEYNATLQAFFAINLIFKIFISYFLGTITPEIVSLIPIVLIGSAFGTLIGIKVFNHLNSDTVKKYVYLFMAVIGFWYIIQ